MNNASQSAMIDAMRQAGLTDAIIRLAVPGIADLLDVGDDEIDDEITAWANALDPVELTDGALCRLALSETMLDLEHPKTWLEACDPIGYRAELARLAQAQFSAWLEAVGC